MIEFQIDLDLFRLMGKGHAGFAPAGSDVVCAGASALVTALAGKLMDAGMIGACCLDPGAAVVEARPETEEARSRAREWFELVAYGLRLIADAFPECVRVEFNQGRSELACELIGWEQDSSAWLKLKGQKG